MVPAPWPPTSATRSSRPVSPRRITSATAESTQGDLTGLNLSTKPKALVEFGNMRDSADITVLGSADGRARMADAVVDGILRTIGNAD